jgi:hypothetical protein
MALGVQADIDGVVEDCIALALIDQHLHGVGILKCCSAVVSSFCKSTVIVTMIKAYWEGCQGYIDECKSNIMKEIQSARVNNVSPACQYAPSLTSRHGLPGPPFRAPRLTICACLKGSGAWAVASHRPRNTTRRAPTTTT